MDLGLRVIRLAAMARTEEGLEETIMAAILAAVGEVITGIKSDSYGHCDLPELQIMD